MLSSRNSGKYLTRTYEREKNAGEYDSSNLTADEIAYLEIQDGQAYRVDELSEATTDPVDPLTEPRTIRIRRPGDGILHDDGRLS